MATPAMAIDWQVDLSYPEPEPGHQVIDGRQAELNAELARARSIAGKVVDEELAYSEETLARAVAFLKIHGDWLWKTCGIAVPVPMIGPGPNASVDLFWRRSSGKLLVNIPAAPDALATFYGDDFGVQKAKGTIEPTKVSMNVVACLMA